MSGPTAFFASVKLASLGARSITIDGEAVVLCPKTGLSLFDELHSGCRDRDVILMRLT